ncbi:MAG: hypothetical protein ABIW31_05170 [Novosphingobium sp.]
MIEKPPLFDEVMKAHPGIDYGRLLAHIQAFEGAEVDENEAAGDHTRFRQAVSDADSLMGMYQETYGINSDRGYCEMKYIYFPGLGYSRALKTASNEAKEQLPGSVRSSALELASKITLIAMVGHLVNLLKLHRIDKSVVRKALVPRILLNSFDKDLGDFGCYLIFKCVSTTPEHIIAEFGHA